MSANRSNKIISINKKASYLYNLFEKYEAGISLLGSEVKAIRENKVNIKESYIRDKNNELYLIGMHIGEYSHSGPLSHEPLRERKLLLHKKEINKISKDSEQSGKTIIPIKIYFKFSRVKIQFAVAKGKKIWDKRSSKKDKDIKRDIDRIIKGQNE